MGCTWRTSSMEWRQTSREVEGKRFSHQPSGSSLVLLTGLWQPASAAGGGTAPMPRTGRRSAAQRPQPRARAQPVDGTAPLPDAGKPTNHLRFTQPTAQMHHRMANHPATRHQNKRTPETPEARSKVTRRGGRSVAWEERAINTKHPTKHAADTTEICLGTHDNGPVCMANHACMAYFPSHVMPRAREYGVTHVCARARCARMCSSPNLQSR